MKQIHLFYKTKDKFHRKDEFCAIKWHKNSVTYIASIIEFKVADGRIAASAFASSGR